MPTPSTGRESVEQRERRDAELAAKIPDAYQLPDGTRVQWRTVSGPGGETIDVFGGSKQLKVHLGD